MGRADILRWYAVVIGIVLMGLGVLLLTGCSQTNISDLVREIAQDKNPLCIRTQIGTVYGTGSNYIGRGPGVKISEGGCEIQK